MSKVSQIYDIPANVILFDVVLISQTMQRQDCRVCLDLT